MTKIGPFLFAIWLCTPCLAQEYKEASTESQAYHKIVEQITIPPYSIEKIRALIDNIKLVDNEDGWTSKEVLNPKTYATLSIREKFTYHMIHGETYAQNCEIIPPVQEEQKKLFGYLSNPFGENEWADRQKKFFKDNKDSVVTLMTESIRRSHHVGLNYKQVIVDVNATEMIPLLISTYNEKKNDHDILTVLMLLMRNNKYAPFMSSLSWQKLYGDQKSNHRGYLDFSAANEQLIIRRATDFYSGSSGEEQVFAPAPDMSHEVSTPTYSLEKIRSLIRKMQTNALPDADYLDLSPREKLTYNMIRPESYRQNCSAILMPDITGKTIAAEMPNPFGEYYWGDRQRKFFLENRDSVIKWIIESVGQTHIIGTNYKQVLLIIDAQEMIPFLKNNYLLHQDNEILTVLMLFMKEHNYTPFQATTLYKELYDPAVSRYNASTPYTKTKEFEILQQATNYYSGLTK